MMALQCPESLISLRKTLGLQYGIAHSPVGPVHYIPASRQLALAKQEGAGRLAHEWFRAFDHYMGRKAFRASRNLTFASGAWLDGAPQKSHPLNQYLGECFKAVLLNHDGTQPSEFFRRSWQADQSLQRSYYTRPEELCARAFEAFVADRAPLNRFLVNDTLHSDEAYAGLYPQGRQRQVINKAFGFYFQAQEQAF
ncbi:hypothetical protein RE428_49120 (plasmid) [Marinobacter nanhaiticus D15-8W]|nr:hypothetical protein RE428_49120 [Marinobacter nanhaiticus D15-8W]